MDLNTLTAISPIDGRYRKQVKPLAPYFSEYGLFKYRVKVEVEYFIALSNYPLPQLTDIPKEIPEKLRTIVENFSLEDAVNIKELEKDTNHDVKAVEYFIKNHFDSLDISPYKEFVHFGLTSQDINNTAIPLLLKEGINKEIMPALENIRKLLQHKAREWADISMLARTHGQPASPTKLGKEFMVFVERLDKQIELLKTIPYAAKFGGATGNFNAHHVAYPHIDWNLFANKFINEQLRLKRSEYTTQIEHYDNLAAIFDNFKRINTILLDLSKDIWQYISSEYFRQKIKENETGSSAMPHKVNPIDFENAEGNLGIANALFEHFAAKLPISRLQRDLTDSTVLRNIGTPLAHLLISLNSLEKGINKIELNTTPIEKDLNNNWAVIAEGIQTILRRENYPNPYEALKSLTRTGEKITQEKIAEFIDSLDVEESVKSELKNITPFNYTGISFKSGD